MWVNTFIVLVGYCSHPWLRFVMIPVIVVMGVYDVYEVHGLAKHSLCGEHSINHGMFRII